MRVCVITTSGRDLTKRWEESSPGLGTAVEALLQGFRNHPRLEVHVMMAVRNKARDPWMENNIIYHEIKTPGWGMMKSLYLGSALSTRRVIQRIKPDIVHAQGTERECAVCGILSGYPNVLTIHGNMRSMAALNQTRFPQFEWIAGRLESWSLPRTGGVLCNSAYTESLAAPHAKQVWRVPNAVREDFFKPQPNRGKNAFPVLLNVGVVSPHKRQVEILEMARELYTRGGRFQINFIGSCDETPYGHRFLEMLSECAEFARHTPHMQTGDLIARFDAADALIHFPEEEAFGLVVAEALARNLRFFGARLGGVVDICEGVEGAGLVDGEDWNGLRAMIEEWIVEGFNRPTTASLVMADRYHPKVVAGQHFRIYREIMDAGCRSEDLSR